MTPYSSEALLSQRTYSNLECIQFIIDMKAIELATFHHKGRFDWEGPAVWVSDNDGLKKALDSSTHQALWDRYKEGYLVFPSKSDVGVDIPA